MIGDFEPEELPDKVPIDEISRLDEEIWDHCISCGKSFNGLTCPCEDSYMRLDVDELARKIKLKYTFKGL